MNKTIAATKARQQFFKLIQQTDKPGKSITITVEGVPKVVMMSHEDFEGWQETLEVISDPKLLKNIKQGLKDIKEGKTFSEKEVKKELNV